ncbi:hypothetical protein N7491_004792 [Penicillium cf. griseofulvum]|uniref:Uncharacterized protein n=1 Tax=Penicillium cf. griseofulvum TaxID=2972120 RepID=A0A9W9M5X5_9EURO|nr:hypothetical protein N7472_007481 [Penicillium cf. griseofulvum]KAJ5434197.1 hypothetical protein N7491_004792 [Penicillium cf. griseofulvum]KAJ5452022.1 hypothetical protein N7445_000205 [Penicillium cf. griseofulvum]
MGEAFVGNSENTNVSRIKTATLWLLSSGWNSSEDATRGKFYRSRQNRHRLELTTSRVRREEMIQGKQGKNSRCVPPEEPYGSFGVIAVLMPRAWESVKETK